MTEYIQVMTTTEKKEDAQKIAKSIVERRLAGCVQVIGPITSTFWWENKVNMAEEWLCLIKSEREIYEKLEKMIRDIHPYDVPEILAIPVIEGSKNYLEWLNNVIAKN